MANGKASLPVIKRLPRYHRYICQLYQNGVTTVSSSELASIMGTTASQVRQDFNCFGGFGQQGIGYNVETLRHKLENLLFSGNKLSAILIGTGKLGRAVSQFLAKEAQGFHFIAAFDSSPAEIGRKVADLIVLDVKSLHDFCIEHHPQVAVLCIPAEGAQQLAPILTAAGVSGFWNFSHFDLTAENPDIVVENVHLGDSLSSLGYRVRDLLS